MAAEVRELEQNFWNTSRRSRLLGDCQLGMLSSLEGLDFEQDKTFWAWSNRPAHPQHIFRKFMQCKQITRRRNPGILIVWTSAQSRNPVNSLLMNQFGDRKVRQNSVRFHAKATANRPQFLGNRRYIKSDQAWTADSRARHQVRHHRHRGKFQTSNPEGKLLWTQTGRLFDSWRLVRCRADWTEIVAEGPRQGRQVGQVGGRLHRDWQSQPLSFTSHSVLVLKLKKMMKMDMTQTLAVLVVVLVAVSGSSSQFKLSDDDDEAFQYLRGGIRGWTDGKRSWQWWINAPSGWMNHVMRGHGTTWHQPPSVNSVSAWPWISMDGLSFHRQRFGPRRGFPRLSQFLLGAAWFGGRTRVPSCVHMSLEILAGGRLEAEVAGARNRFGCTSIGISRGCRHVFAGGNSGPSCGSIHSAFSFTVGATTEQGPWQCFRHVALDYQFSN